MHRCSTRRVACLISQTLTVDANVNDPPITALPWCQVGNDAEPVSREGQ